MLSAVGVQGQENELGAVYAEEVTGCALVRVRGTLGFLCRIGR
jgi:hypothetical protein